MAGRKLDDCDLRHTVDRIGVTSSCRRVMGWRRIKGRFFRPMPTTEMAPRGQRWPAQATTLLALPTAQLRLSFSEMALAPSLEHATVSTILRKRFTSSVRRTKFATTACP